MLRIVAGYVLGGLLICVAIFFALVPEGMHRDVYGRFECVGPVWMGIPDAGHDFEHPERDEFCSPRTARRAAFVALAVIAGGAFVTLAGVAQVRRGPG